jgi:hypothetical protein
MTCERDAPREPEGPAGLPRRLHRPRTARKGEEAQRRSRTDDRHQLAPGGPAGLRPPRPRSSWCGAARATPAHHTSERAHPCSPSAAGCAKPRPGVTRARRRVPASCWSLGWCRQWRRPSGGRSAFFVEDRAECRADGARHIDHRAYASGRTTVTGQLACSTQCSPTDPINLLADAPRPRWPMTSNSAPSAAPHKTSPG